MDIPDIWKKFVEKYQLPNAANYPVISSWISDYESISPMHQLATKISEKYKVGIISNIYRDYFPEMIRQKFIPYLPFNPVIISAEVGLMKPDRAIYEIAQNRSGFSGSEILFIDDKEENLVVPRTLGWQTFLFDYHDPVRSCTEISKILFS